MHPNTKLQGLILANFRKYNQPAEFMSLTYKQHPSAQWEGSTLQTSKTFTISIIQSLDCKDHPTIKHDGSETAELLKIGVNRLQIRSKDYSKFFNWFCNIRDQAITPSNHSSHQEIESKDYSIQFKDCTIYSEINTN